MIVERVTETQADLVRIYPLELNREFLTEQVRGGYVFDSLLAYRLKKELHSQPRRDQEGVLWDYVALERNPELDGISVNRKDGRVVRASEVAEENLRRMAQATAAKWLLLFDDLLTRAGIESIPVNTVDGRVRIVVPGAHFGFEIGGILDWCNAQGIAVDIEAVDPWNTGHASEYLGLPERTKLMGSRVNFVRADAREALKGETFDIAVIRHPGPVYHREQQQVWRGVFESVAQTKPGLVILSTFDYSIGDPLASIGRIEGIDESELFEAWMKDLGYVRVAEERNEDLEYPRNVYGVDVDGEKTRVMDRLVRLYRKI